jgi:hypothetical protein
VKVDKVLMLVNIVAWCAENGRQEGGLKEEKMDIEGHKCGQGE